MENYFIDTENETNKDLKFYVLVIYDIIDNKRRTKLAKIMKSYGFRVQKSAFEAWLTDSKYEKCCQDLNRLQKATTVSEFINSVGKRR